MTQLKRLVPASDQLAGKFAKSDKSLKTVHAEMALLKEQVARADTNKANSDKLLAQVREESEECMVRLNVAFIGGNRAEKLTLSLVAESVNAFDVVLQQFRYEALIRIQKGLGRAYLTVRMSCVVA